MTKKEQEQQRLEKFKKMFAGMTEEQHALLDEYLDLSVETSRLKKITNSIAYKMGMPYSDYADLYSDAIKVLCESIASYDPKYKAKFETYLRNNLKLSFSEWRRNRYERGSRNNLERDENGVIIKDEWKKPTRIPDLSFDAPSDDGTDIKEKIASHDELDKNELSTQMIDYLNNLSKVQRLIITYLANGYKKDDILTILHIDDKLYNDSLIGIRNNPKLKYLRIIHRR